MNREQVANDSLRKNGYGGDIKLSPGVHLMRESRIFALMRKIQEFNSWANGALKTHHYGLLSFDGKRFFFCISKQGNLRTLEIKRVDEIFQKI